MNESRISQLLQHSRSRHEVVQNPQLKRISKQWQAQKRASRDSLNDFQKMLRQLRYFSQLNQKLSKEVQKGKNKVKMAESVHERHNQDNRKREYLQNLRMQEQKKNVSLATKVKEDRFNRLKAIQKDMYTKRSKAEMSRSESRRLRQEREENRFEEFLKNKSKVEQVIQFECNLKESAVRKKESDNLSHIRHYQEQIEREKELVHIRERKSVDIKKKLKTLTESSATKLHVLDDVNKYLIKFKSPYRTPLVSKKKLPFPKLRCYTQKNSVDKTEQESTIFVSQHNYEA